MKKSKLCKAIAMATALGGLGAGVYAPTAGAVNLPANGLGEVLIFPYYTTRDNWQTTLTMINTDENNIIAVKLRFMEGMNSRDVLDFNVILSPGDVFAGVVEETPGGAGPRFRRAENDTTCTSPFIASGGSLPLSTAAFSGNSLVGNATIPNTDGGPATVDRLREGYVLAVVMGHAPRGTGGTLGLANHVNGVNPDAECQAVANLFAKANILSTARLFGEPINALKGNYSFLNVPRGTASGGNATALANLVTIGTGADPTPPNPNCTVLFTDKFGLPVGSTAAWWDYATDALGATSCPNLISAQEPFDFLEPSLNDAYPPVAVTFRNNHAAAGATGVDGVVWTPASEYGFLAVSEVLRARTVYNEWSINPGLGVSTDWVITHPTKAFFVDRGASPQAANNAIRFPGAPNLAQPAAPLAPFVNAFAAPGRSCNDVGFRIWNREEVEASPGSSGVVPSPAQPQPNLSLCYETNVIPFTNPTTTAPTVSPVFGSVLLPQRLENVYQSTVLGKVAPFGWMMLNLDTATAAQAAATTLNGNGLPAVGFMIRQRVIPQSILDSYIDQAEHAYVR